MISTKFQVNWPFGSGKEAKNRFSKWPPYMVAILDFWLKRFKLLLNYKSPRGFLPGFKSNSILVQEKKRKIDFQDGHHGSHLGFLIRTILSIFDLQVTLMLPTKFGVNWPFSSGVANFWFPIRTILAFFNLQKKGKRKSRECHNHKPQPFPDPKRRKRKPTNPNKHKSNKRRKST